MPSIDGLISGLDTTSIVQQLLQFSRQPIEKINSRIDKRQAQKDAITLMTTRFLDLKLSAFNMTKASTYNATGVASSNESILRASGTTVGSTGSFDFRVARLARSSQLVSDGMPDTTTSTVRAGSFTVEMGDGFVDKATRLESINGGEGFARGSLRVTDGVGATQVIDLGLAVTVQDIIDTLNAATGVQIHATVAGDGLVVRDQSGGGTLSITEVGDGSTADSLGLLKSHVAGVISGNGINTLKATMRLDALNDGNGIRTNAGNDLTFAMNDSSTFSVNLGSAEILQDVLDAINNNAGNGGKVTASLDKAGKNLRFVDNTVEAGGTFSVTAVVGPFGTSGALVDLGLEGVVAEDAGTGASDGVDGTVLVGKRLIGTLNSLLTRSLNGGRRADGSQGGIPDGSLTLSDRQGNSATINLSSRLETTTSADPALGATSIFVTSTAGMAVGNSIRLTDGSNSEHRVITALNTGTGEVTFSEGLSFDFAAVSTVYASNESVNDVINAISGNTDINLTAKYNRELNGLKIVDDNTGTAIAQLSITESGGTVAEELGILTGVTGAQTVSAGGSTTELTSGTLAALDLETDQLNGLELTFTGGPNAGQTRTILDYDHATGIVTFDEAFTAVIGVGDTFTITGIDQDSFNGFDLNKRYIGENSQLSALNYGSGVFQGRFQVTDRNNKIFQVNLSNLTTVGETLLNFNAAALAVGSDARLAVNEHGNGLIITSPTGAGQITVQDLAGGTTAKDLNLAGTTTDAEFNGSYEKTVTLDGTETLTDVRNKLLALNMKMSVTIINDGAQSNPYRLNVVSRISGQPGRILMDSFDNSFNFTTTTRAEDAALIFGGSGGGSAPVLVSSSKNTISNLIPGLTLDLKKVSSESVTVTIDRNTDSIVSTVESFLEGVNEVLSGIHELIAYDQETETPGLLQGNSTLRNIERQLFRSLTSALAGVPGPYNRASTIGISVSGDGTSFEFDDAVLRSALDEDFDAVQRLLDLGASIQSNTQLGALRGGQGVRTLQGANDFTITLRNGTRLELNIDSSSTITEVLAQINRHANNDGSLVATLREDGEGLKLTDSSVGTGSFVVTANNGSRAAGDLGIQQQGITNGSNAVIRGFSLRDQGIFGRLNGSLGNIVDNGGSLASQTSAFDAMISDLQAQIERIEDRVSREQDRLFREFTALEQALGQLQNQSSFVAGLLPR